jgi:hypothetical protein
MSDTKNSIVRNFFKSRSSSLHSYKREILICITDKLLTMKKVMLFLVPVLLKVGAFTSNGQSNLAIICETSLLPSPSWGPVLFPDTLFKRIAPMNGDVEIIDKKYFAFGFLQPMGSLASANVTYSLFHFSGPSDIGIDSGIFMATTRVINLPSNYWSGFNPSVSIPATYNSSGYNPGPNLVAPYWPEPYGQNRFLQLFPELNVVNSGDSVIDANVMQFDFIAKGPFISLNYVFASEEYPANACKTPNDVMGIFLSKPGQSWIQNLALVPGTNIPVGVNTINNGSGSCEGPNHEEFYVDYLGNNGQNLIFNGFTTPLIASANVTPCDTYRLKIAVADGAKHDDFIYQPTDIQSMNPRLGLHDSGLFIKAGSLRSTDSLWVEAMGGAASTSLTPYAVRDCMPARFRIHRATAMNATLTVQYVLGGTAQSGLDFQPMIGTATIAAWQSYVDVPVQAIGTGDDRTLSLYLLSPFNNCSTLTPDTLGNASLNILPRLPVHILTHDTTICYGCSIQIAVTSADPGLQYSWSPATELDDANAQSPWASPTFSTHYRLTATAPGSSCMAKDSVWIYVDNSSIRDRTAAAGVNLLPNPFNNSLRFETIHDPSTIFEFSIYDLLGRKFIYCAGSKAIINNTLAQQAATLPNGSYFALIRSANIQSVIKIIRAAN